MFTNILVSQLAQNRVSRAFILIQIKETFWTLKSSFFLQAPHSTKSHI